MSGSEGIYTPTDFNLQKLMFYDSSGQSVDLRPIFVELNLYEDLFNTVMSGNLVVTDSTNIFAYFTTLGDEFLDISLDKPGLNKPIQKTFRVFGKPKVGNNKPTNQSVMLSFASEELLVSKSTSFSKSYNNMLISDMVKDVGKTYLKLTSANFPDNNIETTQGITTLVVPQYNPLQTMNWMASKARSSYVGATYLFYENRDGFWFQSMQKMMDVTAPTRTINYSIKNVGLENQPGVSDPNLDFYDASSYEPVSTPNTLDNLISGKYSSTLLTIDPLRQVFTAGDLNADDLYQASVNLGSGKPYNGFTNLINKNTSDSYQSHKKFYPTNKGQQQAAYIQGKQNIYPTNVEDWLIERNAQLLQLLSIRVKLVCPGDVRLRVGDVIQFNMPSIEDQTGTMQGGSDRKLDPYYSGLYIITAVRHNVTIRTYETILEISKNALDRAPGAASITDTSQTLGTLG